VISKRNIAGFPIRSWTPWEERPQNFQKVIKTRPKIKKSFSQIQEFRNMKKINEGEEFGQVN
jgi:hypothetical protein